MKRSFTVLAASLVLGINSVAYALPFSAETTTRESLRITSVGASPTYAQLSDDSKELVFVERSDGNIFTAFASKDSAIDDYAGGGAQYNRCNTSGRYHIYWYDRASGRPGVCLSWDRVGSAEGNADSYNPKIGGASGDEGRYVAYETFATNLDTVNGSLASVPLPQIMVHDRKFELNWLSNARCSDGTATPKPNAASTLTWMSDDGGKILLHSNATNLTDNVAPPCTDVSINVPDTFIRDGASCKDPGLGRCQTAVLYDDFDLHAGGSTITALDGASRKGHMTSDQKTVVFETDATIPVRFLPDVRNHIDVYRWKGNVFSLVSQTQLAIQAATDGTITVKNVGGAADGDSNNPKVDDTGKLIVFDSVATDLVLDNPGVTTAFKNTNGVRQIYLYDLDKERIEMISITSAGAAGNGASRNPWISRDGRFIAYESTATNLVTGLTTTSVRNIFLRDRVLNQTYIVTPGTSGSGINADATITHLGKTGLLVAFQTTASDANASTTKGGADTNGKMDTFLAANACPKDTDGDSTPDCLDLCPTDINKTNPLQCGCGKAETDSDSDGVADCNDTCKTDPNKSAPGFCGCGLSDVDTDKDGTADCADQCSADPTKTSPGFCGCGSSDTQDADADGTPDCVDECPADSTKGKPGVCGCGRSDADANANGAEDCLDPTASTVPKAPARIKITANKDLPDSIRYRAVVTLGDSYKGRVNYNVTLTGPNRLKRVRVGLTPVFRFVKLSRGAYQLKISYTVGTGANAVTTQVRTVNFSVKGS